ncbi:MAG: hypothetical protein V1799_13310 [bacterium]
MLRTKWYCFIVGTSLLLQSGVHQVNAQQNSNRLMGIAAGMGIGLHTAPSLTDYLNTVAQPRVEQKIQEFASLLELFIAPELQISEEWILAIEYSHGFKSYLIDDRNGYSRSDITYRIHMPSLIVRYWTPGEGYFFEFGGGVGYHVAQLTQTMTAFGFEDRATATGLGFKLEAVGNTRIDKNFYGRIGLDIRWEFLGRFSRQDGSQLAAANGTLQPTMNFYSFGLKLGVTVPF